MGMPDLRQAVLSMADWFKESFGAAVDDIRAKLIEEGWFGRRTVDPSSHSLGWSLGDHPKGQSPSPQPDLGHDLDR